MWAGICATTQFIAFLVFIFTLVIRGYQGIGIYVIVSVVYLIGLGFISNWLKSNG